MRNRENILQRLGLAIKLARKRRKILARQVAERAGISRKTLWMIESGTDAVSIGTVIDVLAVLGLAEETVKGAEKDEFGYRLMDIRTLTKKR